MFLPLSRWQQSLSRFKHILNNQQRYGDIQVYYIPGNHDIGYASLHSYKPEVIKRYEKEFGMRNYRFTARKVEFLAVDALTLDGNQDGNLASATWDFFKNVSVDVQLPPRVLLTNIHCIERTAHLVAPIANLLLSISGSCVLLTIMKYSTRITSLRNHHNAYWT